LAGEVTVIRELHGKGLTMRHASFVLAAVIAFGGTLFSQADPPAQAKTDVEQKAKNPANPRPDEQERKFASACGMDFDQAGGKMYVNSQALGWRPYTGIKYPPQIVADEDSLFIDRTDGTGKHYVRSYTPGQDFDVYQDDCFRDSGKLEFFHFEFRTAWGWGYEEARRYDAAGKFLEKTSRYFDTLTEKPIDQPVQAKELVEELKPQLHKTYSTMPYLTFFAQ
jgi:hypothetical protein